MVWAVKDLAGGPKPSPIDLYYNGEDAADSTTLRYKGSLVKIADGNNAAGRFLTWAGTATLYENLFGILEEEQGTSGNYMPSDTLYGMVTKKITPLLPTTIVRGEYARTDPAGGTIFDTGATASAAATTFTVTMTAGAADLAGGWIWCYNGANAGYLHYVEQNTTTAATFGTATVGAVASGNEFLVIQPPQCFWMKMDDHEVNLESSVLLSERTLPVVGLMHYLSDDGIPFQKLDRAKHDGLKLNNPRFYHDFVIGGSASIGNVWRDVPVRT